MEENKKNVSTRKVYQNAHEIAEDWLKKIKYTRLKNFNNVFSIDEDSIGKENLILEKIKIECLRTPLEFFKVYLNLLRT